MLPQRIGVQGPAADSSQTFVSQIAPDLAIVTEVSLDKPYVGQQFSVIYKLRAQHPPAAVDIDPQQYPGFWTEVVPLTQDSASAARALKGQEAVDFLLRQVTVYPLLEGTLKLPPLSVKVKRSGRLSAQRDDWDVVGASVPVDVQAIPLPPGPRPGPGAAFVGSVEGSLSREGEGQSAIVLEMQGTANLALFRPLDWLPRPAGVSLHARLAAAENLAQIVDREGKRQLLLLQRQRWEISLSGGEPGRSIEDLYLPVFEPHDRIWKTQRIEGIKLRNSDSPALAATGPGVSGSAEPGMRSRFIQSAGARWVMGIAGFAAILALVLWQRRKRLQREQGGGENLAALERKLRTSPRAFLDSAHKILEKWAAERQRSHDLGLQETPLDRCWASVQRYRFNLEPLPAEVRDEILQAIRQILQTSQGTEMHPHR